ncbi:hypothetical protein POM88_029649 [Heracleum sosnowskyi]|uniref:Gnk2-homologous domain-containing protein n=1 Tax=Heracleum sosnowskyi TaxID=360622 RepID=A0AAD8MHC1_9APIA|nr:hypothetical protein POM88_029649 [Heracleum sosnowskyi]
MTLPALLKPVPFQLKFYSTVNGVCSKIKYTPGSAFGSNLNSLLTSLLNSSTSWPYKKYTTTGSSPEDIVYGSFQCSHDLAKPNLCASECQDCMMEAIARLKFDCKGAVSGGMFLAKCYVEYSSSLHYLGPTTGEHVYESDQGNAAPPVTVDEESANETGVYTVKSAYKILHVEQELCHFKVLANACWQNFGIVQNVGHATEFLEWVKAQFLNGSGEKSTSK